jgi:hypothetical protein
MRLVLASIRIRCFPLGSSSIHRGKEQLRQEGESSQPLSFQLLSSGRIDNSVVELEVVIAGIVVHLFYFYKGILALLLPLNIIVNSFSFRTFCLDKKGKIDFNLTMRILHYMGLFVLLIAVLLPLPVSVLAAG